MPTIYDRALTSPILVTGTPRSGKSLTAAILASSPGMFWACEPLSNWAIGASNRNNDRRFAYEATPETARQIRELCGREVLRAGQLRYLDDLSYHALRIDFVRAIMPDALIVHLIQDGYVAIPQMVYGWTFKEPYYRTIMRRWRGLSLRASLLTLPRLASRSVINHWASKVEGRRRAWGPQPPGLAEFAREHKDPAEVAAFQWKALVEIALEDLTGVPNHQAMTLHLEDLVSDTANVVRKLAQFCRIDDVAPLVKAAEEIIEPHYEFNKRVELSQEQWKRVERIIAPLRERLGYTRRITPAN